jgi:hypothetical protein
MKPMDKYQGGHWTKIRRLPYLVAMGMEGAGRSGIAGSARERQAMVQSLVEGGKLYPDNEIIQAIIPKGTEEKELLMAAAEQHDEILNCLHDKDIQDNRGLQKHLFNVLVIVLGVLSTREKPEQVGEYKNWLLRIAENVANAGKEGDFMGIGGERFSQEERDFYTTLEERLG